MKKLLVAASVVGLLFAPGAAQAQLSIGAQGSLADDFDFGVGGRVSYDLRQVKMPVIVMGSYDWFFPKDFTGIDNQYWEVNLNAAYIQSITPVIASYVGVGVNYANFSSKLESDGSELASFDEVGLNLMGGAKFLFSNFAAFGEARFEVNGGEQFVLLAGLEYIFGM